MFVNFAEHRNIFKEFKLDRYSMVAIAIALLIAMALFGAVQKIRLDILQKKNASLAQTVLEMRKSGSAVSGAGDGLFARDAVFLRFEKRVLWSDVLKRISANISERAWLTAIKKSQSVPNGVELWGNAADQASVADLVKLLKDVKDFKDVKLLSSAAIEADGGRKSVSFTVLCEIRK